MQMIVIKKKRLVLVPVSDRDSDQIILIFNSVYFFGYSYLLFKFEIDHGQIAYLQWHMHANVFFNRF